VDGRADLLQLPDRLLVAGGFVQPDREDDRVDDRAVDELRQFLDGAQRRAVRVAVALAGSETKPAIL